MTDPYDAQSPSPAKFEELMAKKHPYQPLTKIANTAAGYVDDSTYYMWRGFCLAYDPPRGLLLEGDASNSELRDDL